MHLPTELPTTELRNIFDFIRGNPNNLSKTVVIDSAWWVVGYGLSMTVASNPGFIMSQSFFEANELENMLKNCIDTSDGFKSVDWSKLVKMIISLLNQWVNT